MQRIHCRRGKHKVCPSRMLARGVSSSGLALASQSPVHTLAVPGATRGYNPAALGVIVSTTPAEEHRVPAEEHRVPAEERCTPAEEHRTPAEEHRAPA